MSEQQSRQNTTFPITGGQAHGYLAVPASGSGPGVLVIQEWWGLTDHIADVTDRLAAAGFVALAPDLYGGRTTHDADEAGSMMMSLPVDQAAKDLGGAVDFLLAHDAVTSSTVGAVGFCMGGGMALAAAGTWPDRFAAVASFHGGNLATDAPASPHRLAPQLQAEVHIAAAADDATYPPAMAKQLETALADAGVTFTTATHPAAHGWMMPDFPVYDAAEAERGWAALLALFGRALG